MTFFARLSEAARKRSEYRRTRDALRALPIDVALDLDIYSGEADAIARRSVYGR